MIRTLSRLAFALVLASVILATVEACKATRHRCTDSTHYTCDGVCTCDGMECN